MLMIVNMGIHIPGKDGLYIETGPRRLKASNVEISVMRYPPNAGLV